MLGNFRLKSEASAPRHIGQMNKINKVTNNVVVKL
jgi:hypothetical protein